MSAAPKPKRTESQPAPQSHEAADPVAGAAADSTSGVRTIKKYPNRRL